MKSRVRLPLEFKQDDDARPPDDVGRIHVRKGSHVSRAAGGECALSQQVHDGLAEGMDAAVQTSLGDRVEGNEHLLWLAEREPRVVRVTTADLKDLEAGGAGRRETGNLVGLDWRDEVPPVDYALASGDGSLLLEGPHVVSGRLHIRHINDRRDPADRSRLRARQVVLLVVVARHPGVRVEVDNARQDVQSGHINRGGCRSGVRRLDYCADALAVDEQISRDGTGWGVQYPVVQAQVDVGHQAPSSPVSTRWKSGAEGA